MPSARSPSPCLILSGGNAVGLQFEPDQLERFELWSSYYILESPAYYAAYRPVLEWLQSKSLKDVPIGLDTLAGKCTSAPEYLNAHPISLAPLYSDPWKAFLTTRPLPSPLARPLNRVCWCTVWS